MALTTNFNFNPYYDDYNEDKKFLRILFKPGYSVQARELTQLQTLLQKQIERFGKNIFINGSAILDGKSSFQNCISLKLQPNYAGVPIDITRFANKILYNNDNTKRAQIVVAVPADSTTKEPDTLLVQQLYGEPFTANEVIKTNDTPNPEFALIINSGNAIRTGQAFSIEEGVFYFNGYFIKTDAQAIAISKYDTTSASLKVGFDVKEYFVTANEDSTLVDPAQESSNYQAPGADRYKIEMTLATRSFESTDLENFIEMAQFKAGVYQSTRKLTIYNKITDELARRTYDESGNYIVKPFPISAQANTTDPSVFTVTVGPGKGYVLGYEIGMDYPRDLTIKKAKTTVNVENRIINASYGNYVLTDNHLNIFNIGGVGTIDLHCVYRGNVDPTNANTYNTTKIGTARIRSEDYFGAVNTSIGSTYIYADSLFDITTSNISGTIASTTDNQRVTLDSANTSRIDDAYTGAFIRFTNGPAAGEGSKLITDYDGNLRRATVSPPYVNTPVSGNSYRIEFNVQDIESLVQISSGTTINAAADISRSSGIDPLTLDITNKANLFDNKMETPIFNLGANFVANNSVQNITYVYQRQFLSIAVSGSLSTVISADSGEQFITASDDTAKRLNYKIINAATGQVIPSNQYTLEINGTNLRVDTTLAGAGLISGTISVIASVSRTAGPDSKQYFYPLLPTVSATTGLITATRYRTSGNTGIGAATNLMWINAAGQFWIPPAITPRVPGRRQFLYIHDAVSIVKILDFRNDWDNTVEKFNAAVDVTSRFILDNGQRDSYYDWASISLKTGVEAPIGPLVVYVDRFRHSVNALRNGYFSINSYPSNFAYDDIPGYLTSSGTFYELRDCLDFRPTVRDGAIRTLNLASPSKLPKRNSQFNVTFQRYLGRIDKIVLSAEGNYSILEGVPGDDPKPPYDSNRALTLYEIGVPPYTRDLKELEFKEYENRRYTMKDIAGLDKRLKNIEYYTTLSLLENETASKSDVSLFDRSKNGIITDSFVGFDVTDITTGDQTAAIDRDSHELRPSAEINSFSLVFDRANSSNFRSADGNPSNPGSNLFFLKAPEAGGQAILAEQPFATRAISVNPYNVQSYIGALRLKPQSDIWVDVNRLPDVIIQDPANAGMIEFINDSKKWAQIEWGGWNRTSLGSRVVSRWTQTVGLGGRWRRNDTWTRTQWDDNQRRLGTRTYFVPQEVRVSQGDTLVNSETIPWMRKKEIVYTLTSMKPFATIYPFFDGIRNIKRFVSSHNYFNVNTTFSGIYTSQEQMTTALGTLGTNSQYVPFDVFQFNVPNSGRVFIKDGATIVGNAIVTLISGNRIYVDDVDLSVSSLNWPSGQIFIEKPSTIDLGGTGSGTIFVKANVKLITGATAYEYRTGTVVKASESACTDIQLSKDAINANINFVSGSTPIRVVLEDRNDYTAITSQSDAAPAEWTQKESTVTSILNAGTATLRVNPALRTNTTSVIQIGELKVDGGGGLAGSFYCPRGTFRTGEKVLRMTDHPLGDFGEAQARADSRFFAQGRLNTVEERILATIRPVRFVENFQEDRTLVTFSNERVATGTPWRNDPIAETFLVEPTQHPDGIFLSKVRVCFKFRDETIPVRLQIRPAVNGYPSATDVYPFADVVLTPEQVKISDYPSLSDESRYTDFVFEAPVHLAPGEHSVVLLSNSNAYEAWIATKDQRDVNTNAKVSNQPFTGSFFKSQNGQTWTAEQESDMMFRIFYYQFSDSDVATISLELNADELPESNVNYDLMILQTQEIDFSNTSIRYSFNSQKRSDGARTGFQDIIPNEDILMLDSSGARVLDPEYGPSTISVRAELRSRNKDISPVLDLDRFGVITIAQLINNLSLSNTDMTVSNTGLYTVGSDTPDVIITGGGGSGATAVANVVTTPGISRTIDKIIITNGGSGYKTSPNVIIGSVTSGTLATAGYAATAQVIGEDKQTGGNSSVRHIVKRVTLADGFSSGDLRVYLTAHKPSQSSIEVYYKILAGGDQEIWRDKSWQLMTQIENVAYVSEKIDDFAELVFAPGTDNNPDNIVSYTSDTSGEFHEFNSFQIKIVLSGVNTVDVPRVRDFRAMALPAA